MWVWICHFLLLSAVLCSFVLHILLGASLLCNALSLGLPHVLECGASLRCALKCVSPRKQVLTWLVCEPGLGFFTRFLLTARDLSFLFISGNLVFTFLTFESGYVFCNFSSSTYSFLGHISQRPYDRVAFSVSLLSCLCYRGRTILRYNISSL